MNVEFGSLQLRYQKESSLSLPESVNLVTFDYTQIVNQPLHCEDNPYLVMDDIVCGSVISYICFAKIWGYIISGFVCSGGKFFITLDVMFKFCCPHKMI